MKKFYLLLLSELTILSATAQYIPLTERFPKLPDSVYRQGPGIAEKKSQRGTPVFTEDFNIGSASGTVTTGPTFTTDNGIRTTSGANGDIWKHAYISSTGQYSSGLPAFDAPTAAINGFITFDADSAYLMSPTQYFYGIIESPIIDLSSLTSIKISFSQLYRYCCDNNSLNILVGISGDSGLTWTDLNVWDPDVPKNLYANEQRGINFSSVMGTAGFNMSAVKIRFVWDGALNNSHYFWSIDDINIENMDEHELELSNSNMYYSEPFWNTEMISYRQIPSDVSPEPIQATSHVLVSDIFNFGLNTESNVQLEGIIHNSGTTIFSSSDNGGTPNLHPDSTQRATITGIDLSGITGINFTAEFLLNYDSLTNDADTLDNKYVVPFSIGHHFGRDDDQYTDNRLFGGYFSFDTTEYNPYIMGNIYQFEDNGSIHAVIVALSGFQNSTTPGSKIYPIIYEVDTSQNSLFNSFIPIYDGSGTSYEKTLTSDDISSGNTIKWIYLSVPSVNVEAGKSYLAGIGTYGGADKVMIMDGNVYHEYATSFVNIDWNWYYMTSTPKIRLSLYLEDLKENKNNSSIKLSQNSPNPTINSTTINYSISASADVLFEVTDITGKIIYSEKINNAQAGKNKIEFSVDHLSPGIYYYSVSVEGVKVMKKMVVGG